MLSIFALSAFVFSAWLAYTEAQKTNEGFFEKIMMGTLAYIMCMIFFAIVGFSLAAVWAIL